MPRVMNYYNTTNKKEFLELLFKKRSENEAVIQLIPYEKMTKWIFDKNEGDLRHDTNGFFKIQSVKSESFIQPIINQTEHGILGLIIKIKNGIIYCLVQMKIEPGNEDIIQISPTVQATESNYKGLHKGHKVKYINYFISDNSQYKTIYKQLQSEQGSKFFKKRNWNIIIEITDEDIEESDNHFWISLSLIFELLKEDNIINMDLRSILACLKIHDHLLKENFKSLEWFNSYERNQYNLLNEINLNSKLFQFKTLKNNDDVQLCKLNTALKNGWNFKKMEIINPSNQDFIVKFIEVKINGREVTTWSQPIVTSKEKKLNYLFVKKINGSYHYLIQFCDEIGLTTGTEIGPTFHNVAVEDFEKQPYAKLSNQSQVIFEANLSEEGGRFYHVENVYKIFEIPEHISIELYENYYWATLYSLKQLLMGSCNINIEARTLLAAFDWRLIGYAEN